MYRPRLGFRSQSKTSILNTYYSYPHVFPFPPIVHSAQQNLMWPKFAHNLHTVDELPTTLPTGATEHKLRHSSFVSLHPRRHARACFAVLALLSLACLLWTSALRLNWSQPIFPSQPKADPTLPPSKGDTGANKDLPPLYDEWYEYERSMPQHNVSLPFPEGASGLYFYPANHVWGEHRALARRRLECTYRPFLRPWFQQRASRATLSLSPCVHIK